MNQFSDPCAEPGRTQEDHAVWREYLRHVGPGAYHLEWKLPAYSEGISLLAPTPEKIPSLSEINSWLEKINWRAAYHSGFVPAHEYATLQARRIFPIARHIRRLRDFSHSAAPDFIHDVFGHLPMLFEPDYGNLIEAWAIKRAAVAGLAEDSDVSKVQDQLIAAMEQSERDEALIHTLTKTLERAQAAACKAGSRAGRLERFYTWAIEFGLMSRGASDLKIMGAAVLSSFGEMTRVTEGQVRFSDFQLGTLDRPVNYTIYQDEMFKVSSFQKYAEILDRI